MFLCCTFIHSMICSLSLSLQSLSSRNHIVFSGVSSTCVRPQLKDLVLIQTTEWYDLGLQLGIEDAELEDIQSNNPKSVRTCRREMFKAWLRITPNPSYQQLVEALKTVGEISEADRLCEKYGKIMAVY